MPVNSVHPAHRAPYYLLMRACCEGEAAVKALGSTDVLNGPVLPKPSGIAAMELDPETAANAELMWAAYRARATFSELIGPTIDGLIGLAFRVPWEIELPERMEQYRESITPDGKSMQELAEYMTREVLQTARLGLYSDMGENQNPVLLTYTAESIINWRGQMLPTRVVLEESEEVEKPEDPFVVEERKVWRVLELVDGQFVVAEYRKRADGEVGDEFVREEMPTQTFSGDGIPFTIAGSQNRDLEPDKFIPLWPMAKHLLKAYQVSADYYQSLYLTAQATAIFTGVNKPQDENDTDTIDETPHTLGAGTVWSFAQSDAKAFYMEFSGPGIQAQKEELDTQHTLAMQYSHYLTEKGSSVESGEALGQRVKARTASLKSTIINCAYALEQALKNAAIWKQIDPEGVKVTPNLEFSDAEIEATLVTAFTNAVQSDAMTDTMFWQWLRDKGITELEDDEIRTILDDQAERKREAEESRAVLPTANPLGDDLAA